MRTLWIVLGAVAAGAATAGIVYAVRKRRAGEAPEAEDPFDVVEAELIEVEAIPVIGISVGPI